MVETRLRTLGTPDSSQALPVRPATPAFRCRQYGMGFALPMRDERLGNQLRFFHQPAGGCYEPRQ